MTEDKKNTPTEDKITELSAWQKRNKEYLEKIGNQKSDIRKSKIPPASNAFCPSTAGLIAANYVYTNLLKNIKILTIEKSN